MFPSFVAQPSHTMADHPSSPRWRSPTWNWIRRQRRGRPWENEKICGNAGKNIYWILFL